MLISLPHPCKQQLIYQPVVPAGVLSQHALIFVACLFKVIAHHPS